MEDLPLSYNFFLILFLLLGSAFFCFSEGSLFSLGRHQRQTLYKDGTRSSRLIRKLLDNPFKLIVTILFADEVVNVAYSSVVGLTVQRLISDSSARTITLISLAIASPTLLLLGEIGPKTVAVKFPRVVAKTVSYPLHLFHIFITPIRWVLMVLSIGFTKLFGGDVQYEQHKGFTTDELRILVGMGSEEGILNEIESKLVESFYNLEDVPISKIMTPIVNCFFLPQEALVTNAIYEIKKRGFSRIPVYKDSQDNIVGILYSKDLLYVDQKEGNIESYLRTPYFIPRTKIAFDLLKEFQQKRIHMAIVVDEYGRVDGLVTMDDILEELFGEIEDETELVEKPKVRCEGSSLIIPGSVKINDFNNDFLFMISRFGGLERLGDLLDNSMLPIEEEHETIAGFVFDQFGRFPVEGERVAYNGLCFTVNKIQKKRIDEIKVEITDKEVADVA